MKDRLGATEASVAGVRPLDVRGFAAPYQTSLLKPAACLDAVAARLVDIEEDGLPNRMLMRTGVGLDMDAVLQENASCDI
jgi:hypothetical protein